MFQYNPNIYIENLNSQAVDDAITHAKAVFPMESCGAIIEGGYWAFENKTEDAKYAALISKDDNCENHFIIDDPVWFNNYMEGKIDCLVHSHNDCNYASVPDQIQQQELDVPSLIINLRNKSLMDCILLGSEEIAELEGRPFFYGGFDCMTLACDYIRLTRGVQLPTPPHEWEFWLHSTGFAEEFLASEEGVSLVNVQDLTDLQDGDFLFYHIGITKFINHMGVVTAGGLAYHHFLNNVSGRYPLTYARKYLTKVMRLKS